MKRERERAFHLSRGRWNSKASKSVVIEVNPLSKQCLSKSSKIYSPMLPDFPLFALLHLYFLCPSRKKEKCVYFLNSLILSIKQFWDIVGECQRFTFWPRLHWYISVYITFPSTQKIPFPFFVSFSLGGKSKSRLYTGRGCSFVSAAVRQIWVLWLCELPQILSLSLCGCWLWTTLPYSENGEWRA